MEISGKIKWIDEVRTYGSNGFRKKELVITTQEQYPQNILIEFTQEKCELLDKYEIDDNIKIGINIRGREWINPEGQTKYFNSIQGWRIEKIEIPDIAMTIYKQADVFRTQTGNLELVVNKYNWCLQNVLDVERPLIQVHFLSIDWY